MYRLDWSWVRTLLAVVLLVGGCWLLHSCFPWNPDCGQNGDPGCIDSDGGGGDSPIDSDVEGWW